MDEIPVVDFSSVGLEQDNINEDDWRSVAQQINKAFSEIGFVYLKGHGIPKELIQKCFRVSKEFFDLPTEIKLQYERGPDGNGYSSLGTETLDLKKNQLEIRETIDLNFQRKNWNFPKEVADFEDVVASYSSVCGKLTQRILKVIGYGLQLEINVDFLMKTHTYDHSVKNRTALRFLHYPAVDPAVGDLAIKATRCGEHSDYGSITILVQDEENGQGLQVKNTAGQYVTAPSIPDTILVNIGMMMQRWTSDRLIATKHRVLILPDQVNEKRYSIVFFGIPNDDLLLECLDRSNKYPPILSRDFLNMKLDETYPYKHY